MTIGQMFTKLDDLKPFKSTWRVRVKVLHSWRQYVGQAGETMEFVLADEHGGKIHAAAKKKDIGRISKDLKVGEWRVLDNFQVAHATGQFRPTNSKWKMTMTLNTKVSTCSVKNDSQFLELIPIRTIMDGGLNHCILIDFIGQVLNVQEIQTVPVQGKENTNHEVLDNAVMNVLTRMPLGVLC
ncbi:unnamed protein product [Microthlaspi erraticum]|uniref:Replication protein A 70 kDa DNA-binding subunit B/D first OB fold domain-containing protein n=1 Tax=Microthlaspi erraticum TaxID=1685480 RepID=A0A6D2HJA5_9BRAS|nr:unnamed protein product [Microthlaspi erraticum]